jgi:hypothetical protein
MATDKKHIAVYLDPAVEQALIAFCEQKGLKSKKGFMYSAGVNAALAAFFGIADIDNILQSRSNTPFKPSTIPNNIGNIPGNTPSEALAVEVMPGELELGDFEELPKVDSEVAEQLQNELRNLKAENEKSNEELEKWKSTAFKQTESLDDLAQQNKKLKKAVFEAENETNIAVRRFVTAEAGIKELQLQLETLKAENEALQTAQPVANFELPEPADLLNQLKAKRKKSTASLADIEAILEILEGR